MAYKFVDDLDGTATDDVRTRTFLLGSNTYELDLSDANWDTFLGFMEPYTSIARKVPAAFVPVAERQVAKPKATKPGKAVPVYGDVQVLRDFSGEVIKARPPERIIKAWMVAHPEEVKAYNEKYGTSL